MLSIAHDGAAIVTACYVAAGDCYEGLHRIAFHCCSCCGCYLLLWHKSRTICALQGHKLGVQDYRSRIGGSLGFLGKKTRGSFITAHTTSSLLPWLCSQVQRQSHGGLIPRPFSHICSAVAPPPCSLPYHASSFFPYLQPYFTLLFFYLCFCY